MSFHDFFHGLFKFSMALGLVVTFKNFHNFPSLGVFFDLKQLNRHRLWCLPKWVPFAFFNYSSLSYIVLALPSAVTTGKLLNKTLIFHDFQGPTIKFHDFPGPEKKFLNSITFHVFHDLYKPRRLKTQNLFVPKTLSSIACGNASLMKSSQPPLLLHFRVPLS